MLTLPIRSVRQYLSIARTDLHAYLETCNMASLEVAHFLTFPLSFSLSLFTTVGFRGTGSIAFESAVTAVLIEGAIFLFLAVSGIRYAIVKFIPEPVRLVRWVALRCVQCVLLAIVYSLCVYVCGSLF